jgi:poly-gamma-glutamate synthesis protein (capsule biosynthesis protein)
MLGRLVAERLDVVPATALVAPEVVEIIRAADVALVNLECAISTRGSKWPDPLKPFFFRAPPVAVEVLAHLGVDCVTLANNHALDYGTDALLDTIDLLDAAGIAHVGAGRDERAARSPVVLDRCGLRIGIVGLTDHPADFAAGPDRPGVAYADLRVGDTGWVIEAIGALAEQADVVLVSPHWGPNMVTEPVPHVRRAATELVAAGATLVAGHSAHVIHGVADRVLFDLGDFIDDYAVDPDLRNDLGLVFLVTLVAGRPTRMEAVPIAIDRFHTRRADRREATWLEDRFRRACADLATDVSVEHGRFVVTW